MTKFKLGKSRQGALSRLVGISLMVVCSESSLAAAVSSVTQTSCNSRLDVTVSSSERSSAVSATDCQIRTLDDSSGFSLNPSTPTVPTTLDSSAMVSAGGELYEAFVDSVREAAVLLTPNRALMMSRSIEGDKTGVDWNMGLAVQPVSGATNAWLTGTYTLLRANQEAKIVDIENQTAAELSEVFDPVTLRITFDGNSGCSIASYSSWFSYSLTTDPAGAFNQPDGDDYGLHQAVYAGEGYVGSAGVHEDSVHTFTDCDYALSSDGKLVITYDYTDGNTVAISVENSYFVSADLRYLVSTVDAGVDLYRGFEVGVRVKAVSGTQDERNDGVAGAYLFNAPTLELQGATGVLSEPDNEHRNDEKATHCMSRGAAVLSTTTSATPGWNTCTWDVANTCSSRGEEGEAPAIAIQHYAVQGSNTASACRFQVSANGSVDFVVNTDTAEGAQNITYSGAIADNNESLVLRGKYVGSTMANPSDTYAPEREIKNVLLVQALVGVKYAGTLTADADTDGLNNLGEFLYADFVTVTNNDFGGDGKADVLMRNKTTGEWYMAELNGTAILGQSVVSGPFLNIQHTIVSTGDLDGDGSADILTRGTASGLIPGRFRVELTNGRTYVNAAWMNTMSSSLSNVIVSTKDFNDDGKADVLLRNSSTGVWTLNFMNGIGAPTIVTLNATTDLAYTFKGDGDYDGNGYRDLLLRRDNGGDGTWMVVTLDGDGTIMQAGFPSPMAKSSIWQPAVTDKDFNGDGRADVLLRQGSGTVQQWFVYVMNGTSAPSDSGLINMATSNQWQIASDADFNADGKADIMLRSTVTGQWYGYLLNGKAISSEALLAMVIIKDWELKTIDDHNGDGKGDILLRDKISGQWLMHLMSSLTVQQKSTLPILYSLNYELQNQN